MTPYQLGYVHGNNGSKPKEDMYDEQDEVQAYRDGHEAGTTNAQVMARKENERFSEYDKQK